MTGTSIIAGGSAIETSGGGRGRLELGHTEDGIIHADGDGTRLWWRHGDSTGGEGPR